jgi:hypothetical protein
MSYLKAIEQLNNTYLALIVITGIISAALIGKNK